MQTEFLRKLNDSFDSSSDPPAKEWFNTLYGVCVYNFNDLPDLSHAWINKIILLNL